MKDHCRLWTLALIALSTLACQRPVFFPQFVASTTEPGLIFVDDVAMGEDGDFIVTWTEGGFDQDVFGRRFDAETAPLSGSFPMSPDTAVQRTTSSIARDASGRFVVVWAEGGNEIRGRRFAADGTPFGEAFPINTSTSPGAWRPVVASDPSGNFVVTWGSGPSDGYDAVARLFDSNGAPLGDPFTVNAFTTGLQRPHGIAMSKTGFVVTWTGAGSGGDGAFGRLFDSAGTPTAGFQINTDTFAAGYPDVAMNAAGDFIVVWYDESGSAKGRRYDTAGAPRGDVFTIAEGTTNVSAILPKVSSDSAGNFLVVWTSFVTVGESDSHVWARLFDIGGSPVSEGFQVEQITTEQSQYARPSLVDDGSFVVVFESGSDGVFSVKGRKTAVRAAPEIVMDPPQTPTLSAGAVSGNGVFEPGETQIMMTAWVNDSSADVESVFGQSPVFTGPPGADYMINDNEALYDTLPAGQTKGCVEMADCYSVTVSNPPARPAQHWDALFQENFSLSIPHTWVLHLGESFPDVPPSNVFYKFVETLFHKGVTTGCAGGVDYCPTNAVTRAQMAVFLLKSKFGQHHIPTACTGAVFTDVPCTGGPFDPWIEELAGLQITGGCGNGNYCPNNTVTRQQMAVFLLKALEGSTYVPPACEGVFDDVTCPSQFADWIEDLADRQISGGCSAAPPLYCPTNPNNRGQMAVFLVKTFGLVLYGS